mmetsp:Transcript_105009/g.191801  ORF Transcript_105009/g.191801 Transcript_105009/m.191801 type:complete len:193 (+) Transcript_105009:176-754(+)
MKRALLSEGSRFCNKPLNPSAIDPPLDHKHASSEQLGQDRQLARAIHQEVEEDSTAEKRGFEGVCWTFGSGGESLEPVSHEVESIRKDHCTKKPQGCNPCKHAQDEQNRKNNFHVGRQVCPQEREWQEGEVLADNIRSETFGASELLKGMVKHHQAHSDPKNKDTDLSWKVHLGWAHTQQWHFQEIAFHHGD